jgi:hypothetical protein
MYADRQEITLTTDESGDATGYIPVAYGRVLNVIYTKDDYADGVTFAITSDKTGQSIWSESAVNASKTVAPVQAAHLPTGTASTLTESPIVLAGDRIKVVVSSGGNTKSGTFTAIIV